MDSRNTGYNRKDDNEKRVNFRVCRRWGIEKC